MAENVERSTLEIEAPPVDEDASVMRSISLFLVLPALCFVFLLVLINVILNNGKVGIGKVHIDVQYVNIEITNTTTVSLEADISLRVGFKKRGHIDPSPDLGIFNLTSRVFKDRPITSFAKSSFQISENEQLLRPKLEAFETRLTEDQMMLFQKHLREDTVWLKLNGDFKWHIKRGRLLIKDSHRDAYLRCFIPYNNTMNFAAREL